MWEKPEGDYSHGLLIPIAALYFAWIKREELKKITVKGTYLGIVLIAVGLFLHAFGILIKFYFASAVSLILVIFGIILFMLGKEYLRKLLFPVLYLIFMIPLPLVMISNVSFRMKIFASQMATKLLNHIGIIAVRDGSIIKTMHSFIDVGEPCSGLRSLIALTAFGAAFAYLTKHALWKKWCLFLSAIPVAVFSNVIRIAFLGWVSEVYGMEAAHGWVHDFSGFFMFFVAAMCLLGINAMLADGKNSG